MDYNLLKELCSIHAPSGEEYTMKNYLLQYIKKNQANWKVQPKLYHGEEFQDCLILVFGEPRTAVFAHMDSIGFTVRYENQLVPIGGPDAKTGYRLKGEDSLGPIACELEVNKENQTFYKFGRGIDRGASLTFECDFRESDEYIQSCYLDNRLGVFNCLQLAETLEDGMIIFSTYEEHGGGSVPFLAKFMVEKYGVYQALISDITWVTEGVKHAEGVAISMRDKSVPRQSFIQMIQNLAENSNIPYQLEVEASGSSDGGYLQETPYPIDWCFIGAPEDNVHSPDEKVHKKDIQSMVEMYKYLMSEL
ncbi:M20/M25/M40 family metallo-hydrolase [Marivirga arenosa]|uniref:M20/M25/M40 family metallo-hydrolase n=1 Tax=Marivirga arenosa TaxID=3059076 RepID=A0AA52EYN0_9BACT|nr:MULTISPECIES: M20/M25/M40 family metallo-hydrolase [unclassified Marivirga]WMN07630.1 M20/M25/M40 family metallo-hydrolase [Marivirga sp. ABR2-2]WNB18156.1 M20/M25/M40 family metallo-hydrolase [Marivirga sp. BKB1-2]